MRSAQVTFDLADGRAEWTFLREYLVDAWDRIEGHEAYDCAWFWRFGDASDHETVELGGGERLEGGGVILMITADPSPEPIVDAERPRWERHREEGPLEGYEVKRTGPETEFDHAREKLVRRFGETGASVSYRLRPIASRAALAVADAFPEPPAAVPESTEDNPTGVGTWALIHLVMKGVGHDWYGENDACRKAIQNRLRSLQSFYDRETAADELDRVLADLEATDL